MTWRFSNSRCMSLVKFRDIFGIYSVYVRRKFGQTDNMQLNGNKTISDNKLDQVVLLGSTDGCPAPPCKNEWFISTKERRALEHLIFTPDARCCRLFSVPNLRLHKRVILQNNLSPILIEDNFIGTGSSNFKTNRRGFPHIYTVIQSRIP